jgi:hypothetical protein
MRKIILKWILKEWHGREWTAAQGRDLCWDFGLHNILGISFDELHNY